MDITYVVASTIVQIIIGIVVIVIGYGHGKKWYKEQKGDDKNANKSKMPKVQG